MNAVGASGDVAEVLRGSFVAVGAGFGDLVGFAAGVEGGGVVGAGFLNGGEEVLVELVGGCYGVGWLGSGGMLAALVLLRVGRWRCLVAA